MTAAALSRLRTWEDESVRRAESCRNCERGQEFNMHVRPSSTVKVMSNMSYCFNVVWLCPGDVVNDGVTDAINGFLLCIRPSKALDTIGGTPHAVQHVDRIHTRNIQDF